MDPVSSGWHFTVLRHFLQRTFSVLAAQSCLTLCNPTDCSPPGSSVHGILQARILEWVAISFSTVSFWSRDRTQVFWIAGRFFTVWVTREAQRILGICGCFYLLGVDSVLVFNVIFFLILKSIIWYGKSLWWSLVKKKMIFTSVSATWLQHDQ